MEIRRDIMATTARSTREQPAEKRPGAAATLAVERGFQLGDVGGEITNRCPHRLAEVG